MCTAKLTPYNLHVGDWVYIKNKCFRPVRIAGMDDCEIFTPDGDIYKFEELEPVYISNKTIVEFSLPVDGMTLKGKEGQDFCFSVMDDNGDSCEFKVNSIHLLQRHYYGITSRYLYLNWKGANL